MSAAQIREVRRMSAEERERMWEAVNSLLTRIANARSEQGEKIQ